MKSRVSAGLASASLFMIAATASTQTAFAQGASDTAGFELEEIVVTARRKDESLQDVPTTINAVTGADIEKLNIKKFDDIATVVPGLTMANNANGIGASASVRGVNYDVNASGSNGTVEFYLNDAPISAGNLFQAVYDIQQVELLRGPQGTLRGRASPSGSMTVTTRRPDLQEIGGSVNASANNIGGYNYQGAFGIPLVSDVLAIRVAGAYDRSRANGVYSVHSPIDPSSKTQSGRVSLRFEPTDSISLDLVAQTTKLDTVFFDNVESQQEFNPGAPVITGAPGTVAAPVYIRAFDRLAVEDTPRQVNNKFNNYNARFQWAFLGQKLNIVAARNEQKMISAEPQDTGDFFGPEYPATLAAPFNTLPWVFQGSLQKTRSIAKSNAYELRFSNEERVFGLFDYIAGSFYQRQDSPTTLGSPGYIIYTFGPTPPANISPASLGGTSVSDIVRGAGTREISGFLNLTAHLLDDAMELSGGARFINFQNTGTLTVSPIGHIAAADEDNNKHAWIYTGSIKYSFTPDFMVYGTMGTSWRPGATAVGDFSTQPSPLERSFTSLQPEKSTSYELGFKSSALDRRLRTNVSVYHQKFTNYPYRSASGVNFVSYAGPSNASVSRFNFIGAVPVEVNGAEAEVNFAALPTWDVGGNFAVAKGEIKGGVIPCNDYLPADGIPDAPTTYTVAQIQDAVGAQNIASCTVTQRSSSAPQVSGLVQSEYRIPVTSGMTSYVRGQVQLYGSSKNDPTNPNDDYKSYQLLNMYVGLRDSSGVWELGLYGKNVANTERVLGRAPTTAQVSWRYVNVAVPPGTSPQVVGASGGATNYYGGVSTQASYAGMALTPQREFGINLSYKFGSK
jgi:iron complex outermembrane receptor protein